MRNPKYHAYFPIVCCWACFGKKMGLAAMNAPEGLRPQKTKKVGPSREPFESAVTLAMRFLKFLDPP